MLLIKLIRRLIEDLRMIVQNIGKNRSTRKEREQRDNDSDCDAQPHASGSFPLSIPHLLPPLDKDEYPDARFWTSSEWQDYSNRKMDFGQQQNKLGFLCDEDGNTVTKDRIKVMTDTAKKLWGDLHHYRQDPLTWRLATMMAAKYYSNHMCATFPEFRYCADNWKVQAFATIRYPDWSSGLRSTGRLSRSYLSCYILRTIHFFSRNSFH